MRFLILLVLAASAIAQKISYENYKVYKVIPTHEREIEMIRTLENNPNVDFWTGPSKFIQPVNVMVSPKFQDAFEATLNRHHILYKMVVQNVEMMIKEEQRSQTRTRAKGSGKISFDKYYRYSEMQDYLHRLANENPNLVSLENYGSSYENRTLTLIRISSGGNNKKPLIFVDGGIHAREWIAPAQVLYIINYLLERPEGQHLIQNIDWVIIPLLNPDGYEYTHTTDRFWRKTRSKGKVCYGVDPNRNFDFKWNGAGSNKDECSSTYAGPSAFSEPETLALSKVIERFAYRTKLYLTFHSAAKCFLYPWGWTSELPENVNELHTIAEECEKAVSAVNGSRYRIGSSYNTLSPASGSSRDWAYGAAGINLAYTMELPPGGENRFDLPPEEILGVVTEMFEAVKVFHKNIEKKYARI